MFYEEHDHGMKIDPLEKDPVYAEIIKKAEEEAEKNIARLAKKNGHSYFLWMEQKRILKDKYNLNWKSPAEMNPEVVFD